MQDTKGADGEHGNSFANGPVIPLHLRQRWEFAEYPQTTIWTMQA